MADKCDICGWPASVLREHNERIEVVNGPEGEPLAVCSVCFAEAEFRATPYKAVNSEPEDSL